MVHEFWCFQLYIGYDEWNSSMGGKLGLGLGWFMSWSDLSRSTHVRVVFFFFLRGGWRRGCWTSFLDGNGSWYIFWRWHWCEGWKWCLDSVGLTQVNSFSPVYQSHPLPLRMGMSDTDFLDVTGRQYIFFEDWHSSNDKKWFWVLLGLGRGQIYLNPIMFEQFSILVGSKYSHP